MTIIRDYVYKEIADEREHQDGKWGGPDHDNHHNANIWRRLIDVYNGTSYDPSFPDQMAKVKLMPQRERWVKVAALAVAAIEWLDRTELCQKCNGTGQIDSGRGGAYSPKVEEFHRMETCPVCGGATRVTKEASRGESRARKNRGDD